MGLRHGGIAALAAMACASSAHAWYGPFCYSSKARQITLTIPTITGEAPGDLKVSFDDNDGKATLATVRPSKLVKNAHEIILTRDADSRSGVFGLIVTSPRSTYGFKFELEFRDNAADCTGAIIKVSDKGEKSFETGGSEPVTAKAAKPAHESVNAPARDTDEPIDSAEATATAHPHAKRHAKAKPRKHEDPEGESTSDPQPQGPLVGPTMPTALDGAGEAKAEPAPQEPAKSVDKSSAPSAGNSADTGSAQGSAAAGDGASAPAEEKSAPKSGADPNDAKTSGESEHTSGQQPAAEAGAGQAETYHSVESDGASDSQ